MAKKRRSPQGKPSKDDVYERLYAVELEAFVDERKRLERELRDEGRGKEADDVAARRKPSLPIFVANRLARERPDEIARIVDVAEELTRAHRAGDAAKLRAAQSQLGDAIRTVVEEAEKASGRSLSDAMEQRLAATLRAAATDSSAANLLRSGVLQDEIEPTGFDALAGLQLPPAKKAGKGESKPARAGPSERRREASQARIERLEAELAEAGDEVRAAERALSEAERQEKRARERVAALERQLSRARETV